ncbi:MAG TPA: prepilin-type N-terminal cleavage/methylation domain-containing protein [Solirubrobacteraceae bacterium]
MPSARPRSRLRFFDSNAGFTLVEVLVSALIVGLVASAAATAFVGSTDGASNLRLRTAAQALAQQDESRLRGFNVNELSNLSQTLPAVSLDGALFTVKDSADYVSDASGTPSCTNPSADYLRTTSTVTWTNMGGQTPVTVSSVLTPTVGSLDPTHGTLAVSVTNAAGTGVSGLNVNISGPSSASATTAAGGCALFGDLSTGTYGVGVAPAVGTYVDEKTGQAVTPTAPDTASPSPTVIAGTTAASPTPFELDAAGAITFSFADAFPIGVNPSPAPTATAPAVVVFNTGMTTPSFRLCAGADSTCPAVANADTTFPAADWSGTGGQVVATPLFPFTSPYSAYAGVCTSDEPSLFGATDSSALVTAGGSTPASITLPAMVVRLDKGTSASPGAEEALPAGAHLVVTDTGCGVQYIGYTTAPPTLAANQAALPLVSAVGTGANDTGLLTYPGMPYGQYTVCYDKAGKTYQDPATVTNEGNGEIVTLYAKSATTGAAC